MPRDFRFDARLLDLEGVADAPTPILRASISLKAGLGGMGDQIPTGYDGTSKILVVPISIEAALYWAPEGPGRVRAGGLIARGAPASLRSSNIEIEANWAAQYEIDFPLTPGMLSLIEELRSGGPPTFGITLRIGGVLQILAESPKPGAPPPVVPFVADRVWVTPMTTTDHELPIERSRWVEKILPQLGFGSWLVYEVPLENFDGVAQVDTYLANALKQFASGEWKLSMAASRDVVETLERELEANANPAFGDRYGSAEKKIRAVTDAYRDLVEAMLSYQASVKSLLAAGSHPERPEELVDRPDAEMALWVALSLRRYVGMRLRATRPTSSEPTP